MVNEWTGVISDSFFSIWAGVASLLPKLLVALIIFLVGWVIASIIGKIVAQVIRSIKIDSILRQAGVEGFLIKAGFKLDTGVFLGELVKWFVSIIFLVASLQVLGLTQVNEFLQQVVLSYLPRIIIAVLMLIAGVIIAEFTRKLVTGSAKAAGITTANMLGSLSRWGILFFAFLNAFVQLGIAVVPLNTLFTGVVVALSLAFGLSFGLGGQTAAASFIDKIRHDMSDRKM